MNTIFVKPTDPRDIQGTPEWTQRLAADLVEYDSYVPTYDRCNGGTGSTRVKHPKTVKSTMKRKRAV